MNTASPRLRLLLLPLAVLIVLGLTGCPLPNFTGTNQLFVTSGSADDGDGTNGAGQIYTNPALNAADGQTSATSAPVSYRTLRGSVIAQPGPKATNRASAIATNKVTSTFVVNQQVNFKFELSSTASVTLNGTAEASYRVLARILDANGAYVTNSDFQVLYSFTLNTNGKLDVSQDGTKLTNQADNGGAFPAISPTDTGPNAPIVLQPGTYTLQFELNLDARAPKDSSATMRVSASLDPR